VLNETAEGSHWKSHSEQSLFHIVISDITDTNCPSFEKSVWTVSPWIVLAMDWKKTLNSLASLIRILRHPQCYQCTSVATLVTLKAASLNFVWWEYWAFIGTTLWINTINEFNQHSVFMIWQHCIYKLLPESCASCPTALWQFLSHSCVSTHSLSPEHFTAGKRFSDLKC
jgi:hypothetical protein